MSRSKSSLTRAALAAVIFFMGTFPSRLDAQNAGQPRRIFRESVSVATDSQVMKRLGTAQDHLAAQEWSDAVPILQQIIETSGDTLLPVETGRYWNAADFCHLLISRLPAEGLAVYRARVDPQAAEWFEQAEKSLDPMLFGRVVSVAFNSSSADDALWRLGSLAFEQGRYAVARQHWQQLVAPVRPQQEAGQDPAESPYLTYPNSSFAADVVRARMILCTIFEGDGERAERELDVFEKLHAEAEGTLAGQTGNLADILRTTLRQSEAWWLGRDIPDDILTFAGRPSRNPLPASEQSPGRQLWSRSLPEVQFHGQPSPALRGSQWLLSYHPVVDRETVYFCTSYSIFALDLATGENPRWRGEPDRAEATPNSGNENASSGGATDDGDAGAKSPVEEAAGFDGSRKPVLRSADSEATRIFTNSTEDAFRIIRNPVGVPRYTMTITDGRLYARMGPPISRRSPHEGSAISEIVGLDIDSGQGLLVFRVTSDILDPDASSPEATAWSFEGTPVVDDGRVYVSARRGTPEDEIAVACFDAASSQLLWQQRVCSNLSTDFERSSLLDHRLLTLGDGQLFLATGTGAIASLDADSGRILWVVTYDSGAAASTPRTAFLDEVNHPARNGLMPCVYHRGIVFAATTDAGRLFALDASTGQLVWQVETASGQWIRHALGVVDGRLIVCGNHLAALDIFTGETAWSISHPNPDSWTHGRGVLTARSVYWPLRNEIVRVSIRSGEIQSRYQLTRSDGLQGGHLLIVGDRMLIVSHDRITVLKNHDAPPPEPGDAVGLQNPSPRKSRQTLNEAFRRARAAEDMFRPDVASAQYRSALSQTALSDLTPESRRHVEHVAARGLVRSSLALAGVSPEPAKRPYFQTAWMTTAENPEAFSAAEKIRTLFDFAEYERNPRNADRSVRRFVEETGIASEPLLDPLLHGEPVRETIVEGLHRVVHGSLQAAPPESKLQTPLVVAKPAGHLLRRSWTRVVGQTARILVPPAVGGSSRARCLVQESTLACVDAATGDLIWESLTGDAVTRAFPVSSQSRQDANLSEGLLLLGKRSAQCRDADTGQLWWSTRWPEPMQFVIDQSGTGSPRLLCMTGEFISTLDAGSGAELWHFPPQFQRASPAKSDDPNSPAEFFRGKARGFYRPRGLADSFLLDLQTGFALARLTVTGPLPLDGHLIIDPAATTDPTTEPFLARADGGWTIAGISENNRISLNRFAGGTFSPQRTLRKLGIGLHSPLLLADAEPFTLLIENGLMAERIDVRTGAAVWRVRLGSPISNPREMTATTETALFVISEGILKRFALVDGASDWQRFLGEASWRIVEANEKALFMLGHYDDASGSYSELVLCDARSGELVQRIHFPGRVEFRDVHVGSGFVIIRSGNTLHGLAALDAQSPMQTTSFNVR